MKKIIFPTDFSPVADHAWPFAVQVARRTGAEIILTHVYNLVVHADMMTPGDVLASIQEEVSAQLDQRLQKLRKELHLDAGPDIELRAELRLGFPADAIKQLAENEDADLIIMGTHGAGNQLDTWFGSVATRVIDHAPVPVMVIPGEAAASDLVEWVYGASLQNEDAKGLSFLRELVAALSGRLTVLHLTEVEAPLPVGAREPSWAGEYRELEGLPSVAVQVLPSTTPIEGLQTYLDTYAVDALAMVRHERGFLGRVFQPSVTRKLVLAATKPLLVLPEGE